MTEWKEYKLGDVVTFQRGHDLPKDKMAKGDIPVAGSNGIIGYHNQYSAQGPGVTIGRSGNIGIPHYYPNAYWAHNTVLYIIDFKGNDAKFLYYLLKTFDFTQLNTGSAVPSLNRNHIHELPVSIPDVPTQRRIAAILSSLDDKIDLLHRENATLEQMAETLFRQWFVVEAKEEWEEVALEYVCERITDGSHYSPESVEFGLPMASVKDMENWGIDLNSCRKISKEDFDKLVSADCLPQVNDILIAKDGSYLKHIFVVDKMQEVVLLSSIAILRPNGLYHPYLLSILLKLDSTKEELKNIVTGAVIPRIVLKDFRKFPILLPPIEKQKQALSFIEPIMKKCFYNREQIQILNQTRDGLLPRLMSGEVKI